MRAQQLVHTRRAEVYARCANEIVVLTKCVDAAGPLWWFKCNQVGPRGWERRFSLLFLCSTHQLNPCPTQEYMDIQRCYHQNKTWGTHGSLQDTIASWQASAAEGLRVTRERWSWWLEDVSRTWGGGGTSPGAGGGQDSADGSEGATHTRSSNTQGNQPGG